MELHAAVPFPFTAGVFNPPGMTPAMVHVRGATAGTVLGAPMGRPSTAGAGPFAAPTAQHQVLESIEDALLLLLIVFAVPAIIMLLALPIAFGFRVVGEIGRRL